MLTHDGKEMNYLCYILISQFFQGAWTDMHKSSFPFILTTLWGWASSSVVAGLVDWLILPPAGSHCPCLPHTLFWLEVCIPMVLPCVVIKPLPTWPPLLLSDRLGSQEGKAFSWGPLFPLGCSAMWPCNSKFTKAELNGAQHSQKYSNNVWHHHHVSGNVAAQLACQQSNSTDLLCRDIVSLWVIDP